MKKVLLLLVGLIALGCSKDEPQKNENTGNQTQTKKEKPVENTNNTTKESKTTENQEKQENKDVLNVPNKEIFLYKGEEKNVNVSSTLGNKILYSFPKGELHALVDEKGNVKGVFVGNAELTVTDGKNTEKIKISINPRYKFFYEPYTKFGASKDEVKNYMKSGSFEETNNGIYVYNFGDLRDLKRFYKIGYSFKNDKLESIMLVFAFDSEYRDDIINYLGERYVPISSEGNMYIFANPNTEDSFYIGFTFNVFKNSCSLFYSKTK